MVATTPTRSAAAGVPGAEAVARLGEGWVAEEALAVGVCAALAVSHGGDSDSTGSICGNLLGTWHGDTALPAVLAFEVEGRGTILELADQLHGEHGPVTRWIGRY